MDQSENRFYRERAFALADGGPAFPVPDRDMAHAAGSAAVMGVTDPAERDRLYADAYNKAVRGMTLRDYFIAHAPAEPQSWFEPVMPPRPKFPDFDALPKEDQRDWNNERYDYEPEKCSTALQEYGKKHAAAMKEGYEWDKERDKQRCIQWPGAWADEQLRLRGDA